MRTLNNTLDDLLQHLAEASGQTEFLRVHRAWCRLVGPLVAARAYVYKYDRGTVFIGASDSVWIQELMLSKAKWLPGLRKHSGVRIDEILFFPKERPNAAHRSLDSRR